MKPVTGSMNHVFANLMRHAFIAQFLLATGLVRCRFEALNENLKSYIMTSNLKVLTAKPLSTIKCGKVFHSLCDCIEIINKTFTFHFIVMIANSLVSCVFASYGIVNEIMKFSRSSLVATFLNLIGIFIHIIFISLVVGSGSRLTGEAEKTVVIISKIANSSTFNDSQRQVEFMSLINNIQCRNLNVQNDMFIINWSILLAVSSLLIEKEIE